MLSIVIPVFNEESAIASFHQRLAAAMDTAAIDCEIIYVDDASTDGTAALLDGLANGARVSVIHLECNAGYGGALKVGITAAKSDQIAIIDCDGSYDPADIPVLWKQMENSDMVVGRRPSKFSLRNFSKFILREVASYAVAFPIPDLNSGLRIFRKDLATKNLKMLPNGFSFTSTITMAALYMPCRVRFIPVGYSPRIGKSKIRPVLAFFQFVILIARTMVLFNPLKFFVPPSLLFGGLGLIFLVRDILASDIAQASILLLINAFILGAIGLLAEAIRCRN